MKRTFLLILTFALFCGQGFNILAQNAKKAQTQQFGDGNFAGQLLTFLNGTSKDEAKLKANGQLVEQFQKVYVALDEKKQERVLSIYNEVLKHKVESSDFIPLTRVLMEYRASNLSADIFSQWLGACEFILSNSKKAKDFNTFVTFSSDLLNFRYLSNSKACKWQAQQDAVFSYQVYGGDLLVRFSSPINLTIRSEADENTIIGTKGDFHYIDNEWVGQGGRLTWERTGLAANSCYADLKNYSAVVKFPKVSADSVMFLNTQYFPKPIMGKLDDRLEAKKAPEKYNFPQFQSYQKDFQLKNVLPDVDFEGNFMMHGAKFVTNDDKHPATMVFYRNGQRFLTISSTRFTILPNMLTSEHAAVKMYIDADSICNTGILVRYTTADRKVNMINSPKRNFYSPYTDSYHQMDIYCESITWLMDQDVVDFSVVGQSTQNFVSFESNRYYSMKKAREIQGIESTSPVARIYNFMKAHDMRRDFPLVAFSNAIKLDEAQTKLMVHTLSKSGLVSYDEGSGRIHVQDKLIGFYKAISKAKGHDYDALTLESITNKTNNAQLQLSTNDLNVHGVEKFVVSDSQLVVVRPTRGDIVLKRNRGIDFSGRINCGRFVMSVSNAQFNYGDFTFELPQVDSMMFYVTSFNDPNKMQLVRTPLYNLHGNLLVDKPDNHCGLKKNKDFPIFNSLENSYVYYDKREIMGAVYKRDNFYYTLHPFQIKQLTDFKTDSMQFNGALTSAGIFPEIVQPLKVQRDYSLGFITHTPSGGYPAYGGKGTYYDTIDLSYRGLRGGGKLEYLTSTAKTDKYLFEPDSMMAFTDTFYVREDGGYPDIRNSKTLIRWYPYQDSMTISQIQKGPLFDMYHGTSTFSGRVCLQPKGASGYGISTIGLGTLRSNRFNFKTSEMDADTSEITLRSEMFNSVAFNARNMRAHVDMEAHTGEFTSNEELERTLLPALNYAAYVDKFTWDWDHKFLALDNSKSLETGGMEALPLRERAKRLDAMPGARFLSTDPKQYNLQFYAINSNYQYDALQLSNHNVFALCVADAVIAPSGDSLHISNGGAIDLIKNSQLLASRENAYHLFYNADIIVNNGRQYSAKGTIDYIDQEEVKQPIFMAEIASNDKGMTVASGFIPDSARFTLSRAFGFAGKVRIEADHERYYFDGGVRLLNRCISVDDLGLLAYADYCDPDDIRVVVPENPVDWKGNPILVGIHLANDNLKPSPAFLTKPQPGTELLSSFGLLSYDPQKRAYTITSAAKLDDEDLVERYVTLNTDACTIEGEGPINFVPNKGPASIFAFGNAYVDPADDRATRLETSFGLNFPIDGNILNMMAEQLEKDLRPSPSDRDNPFLERALTYTLGRENGRDAYLTYQATGAYSKIPKGLEAALYFDRMTWEYSPLKGFTSVGTASLSHIGKKQLHLDLKTRAQIYKKGNETYVILYVQAASDHWYYFKYATSAQSLLIASSVGEWVDKIREMPKEKRTEGEFHYSITNSRSEVQNFLKFAGGAADDDEEEEDLD